MDDQGFITLSIAIPDQMFISTCECPECAAETSAEICKRDEPFKFVSAGYRDGVRAMLQMLAAELGIQFIMVTHIPELRCGKIIEIE